MPEASKVQLTTAGKTRIKALVKKQEAFSVQEVALLLFPDLCRAVDNELNNSELVDHLAVDGVQGNIYEPKGR